MRNLSERTTVFQVLTKAASFATLGSSNTNWKGKEKLPLLVNGYARWKVDEIVAFLVNVGCCESKRDEFCGAN